MQFKFTPAPVFQYKMHLLKIHKFTSHTYVRMHAYICMYALVGNTLIFIGASIPRTGMKGSRTAKHNSVSEAVLLKPVIHSGEVHPGCSVSVHIRLLLLNLTMCIIRGCSWCRDSREPSSRDLPLKVYTHRHGSFSVFCFILFCPVFRDASTASRESLKVEYK